MSFHNIRRTSRSKYIMRAAPSEQTEESEHSHKRPIDTGVDFRWLSQDLTQPRRRSMLNSYLVDAKEYQAAATLRLWYATYCYTEIASKSLRHARAKQLWGKFFSNGGISSSSYHCSNDDSGSSGSSERDSARDSERGRLAWNNITNKNHYTNKLKSPDVSLREKDGIVLHIKRAAFRFLQSVVQHFDGYNTSYRSKKKSRVVHSFRRNDPSRDGDDTRSTGGSGDGGSGGGGGGGGGGGRGAAGGGVSNYDLSISEVNFFNDMQAEPNYDLSLRLSDLSINVHSSEDNSGRSEESDVSAATTSSQYTAEENGSSPKSLTTTTSTEDETITWWTSERFDDDRR